MAQVLHRLRMDVAQLANVRVRPAPLGQVVTRRNLLMRHHPSKEFAFGFGVCGPNLIYLKGGGWQSANWQRYAEAAVYIPEVVQRHLIESGHGWSSMSTRMVHRSTNSVSCGWVLMFCRERIQLPLESSF